MLFISTNNDGSLINPNTGTPINDCWNEFNGLVSASMKNKCSLLVCPLPFHCIFVVIFWLQKVDVNFVSFSYLILFSEKSLSFES